MLPYSKMTYTNYMYLGELLFGHRGITLHSIIFFYSSSSVYLKFEETDHLERLVSTVFETDTLQMMHALFPDTPQEPSVFSQANLRVVLKSAAHLEC